jgi:hypothetical protein
MSLEIISANYGNSRHSFKDVTDVLKSYINEDYLELAVSNSLFGDPCPGHFKSLYVKYKEFGVYKENSWEETSIIKLNSRKKTFSLIIGFRNTIPDRFRNLIYTVKYYKKYLPECKIIIVEQDTKTDLSSIYNDIDKYVFINTNNDFYSRSLGFNEGFNVSDSDYIILADSDCLLDVNFLRKIHDYYSDFNSFFVIPYVNPVYYLSEKETINFISNDEYNNGTNSHRMVSSLRNASGGVGIISSDNYYRLGGFDERFRGWGVEDDAFHNKAIGIGLPSKRLGGEMVHLYHADSFKGNDNYGNNTSIYDNDYGKNNAIDIVNRIGFAHLSNGEVDVNKIKIVTNSQHDDLLKLSKQFYSDLPFEHINISGKQGMYGLQFFEYLIKNFDGADWIIYIDEDCFITNKQALLDLLYHQIRHNLGFSGMPDGGVIAHRIHNPVSINAFFSIINLKKFKQALGELSTYSYYGEDLKKYTPYHLIKKNYADSTKTERVIKEGYTPYGISYDNFEPYYSVFFSALRKGINPLYLDAYDYEGDDFTTVLKNHLGVDFAHHSWFSRSWNDFYHKERIKKLAAHCLTIKQ